MKFNKKFFSLSLCILLLGSLSNPVIASDTITNKPNNKLQNLSSSEFKQLASNKSNDKILDTSIDKQSISINDIKNNKKVIPFNKSDLQNKIDLHPQEKKDGQVTTSNKTSSKLQLSNNAVAEDASESNTAPVAVLNAYILNPESLRNGMITTNTQIAWLWSDTDADGDQILQRYLDGFPSAYLLGMLDGDIGFVTQFTNPGDFDLYYQVMDTKGARSNIVGYTINVVPVEDYQIFQGNFESSSDVKTIDVAIDFSKMDTAAISLVRTGKTNINLKISDEAGNIIKTIGTSGSSWCFIDKPSSDAGICNYKLTLTPYSESYNSTYNSYRVMVGNKTDIEAMISGIENTILLDKYTETAGNQFYHGYTPNRDEEWFKFTADGSTVITILNDHPQLRFQVRDVNSLEVLFDSNDPANASTHRTQYNGPYDYSEKARLTTTIGQEYYLVLYSPDLITTAPLLEDYINLTVGNPNMLSGLATFYSNSSITGTQYSFSPTAYINVNDVPNTAVVDTAYVKTLTSGVYMSNINYWKIKGPTESYWRTSGQCYPAIEYDYVKDGTTNIPLKGTWQFSFKSGINPTNMIPGLYFVYYYELGD